MKVKLSRKTKRWLRALKKRGPKMRNLKRIKRKN